MLQEIKSWQESFLSCFWKSLRKHRHAVGNDKSRHFILVSSKKAQQYCSMMTGFLFKSVIYESTLQVIHLVAKDIKTISLSLFLALEIAASRVSDTKHHQRCSK